MHFELYRRLQLDRHDEGALVRQEARQIAGNEVLLLVGRERARHEVRRLLRRFLHLGRLVRRRWLLFRLVRRWRRWKEGFGEDRLLRWDVWSFRRNLRRIARWRRWFDLL